MTTPVFVTRVLKTLKTHSPEILTGLGVAGVVTTAYLTGKAAYKSAEIIHQEESRAGTHSDAKERFKERTKLTWRLYIPAGAAGVATIGAILCSQRIGSRRAAAAATAYAIAERGLAEYQDKVVEQLGKGPEQKVRDKIVQEKVNEKPPTQVLVTGTSTVLCCELFTNRYFRSDMETLKRAEREINQRINSDLYVMLSEFYTLIGLPHTSHSDYVGWNSDREFELRISSVLSENNEPCLAFDYNYVRPL